MGQTMTADLVAARQAAELEYCGEPERGRDDRRAEIEFILVLVQRQFGAGLVAVDQARIRHEGIEAGTDRGTRREIAKRRRHLGPWPAAVGIDRVIAIAPGIRDPAD